MDFNVKGWGWVGDIYHKVESMIQEVDDLMKEKADSIGERVRDDGDNKNKFSFLEVQTALQQVEEFYSPVTDEKKPDPCFNESNDAPTDKLCPSRDANSEHVQLNSEQSPMTGSSAGYIDQDAYEPPVVDILVECDEGSTEASKCNFILSYDDDASQIITRHSEITQSFKNYLDQKASETEPAIEAANSYSAHSSMSLVFTSEIGDIDKLSASDMARNLQDDELKDSRSSIPFLIDLTKVPSFEYLNIHFNSSLIDNHVHTSNVGEAVLESSHCEDELASVIEKDLYGMLLTLGIVDGMSTNECKIVANSLPANTMRGHESHLHLEIGETCTKVEISGSDACGSNELVPLTDLLEKDEKQSYEPDTSCAFLIDANMETIDLDDKGELQESCTSVDTRDLFAVSERVKRFRSIKRKILDAFASRQRTAKEYKQLGILHGDIDFEHRGHVMQRTVSALDDGSLTEHPCDSDWELL